MKPRCLPVLARGMTLFMFLASACGGGNRQGVADAVDPGPLDLFDATDPDSEVGTAGSDAAPEEVLTLSDRGFHDAAPLDPGPGEDMADRGPGGPDLPCEPLPPLAESVPFEVLGGFSNPPPGPVDSFLMEAVVSRRTRVQDPSLGDVTEWEFRSRSDGAAVVVRTRLPLDFEVPVALGQRVVVFGAMMPGAAWRDLAFVIWEDGPTGSGSPLFFFYDASHPGGQPWHQCGGHLPCPVARMLEPDCASIPVRCGLKNYPPVALLAYGGLSSGETSPRWEQGTSGIGFERYRYAAIRSERYEELTCEGIPTAWLSAFIGKSEWVSQCVCHDDADCAPGFFCDPTTSRCVEDLCRPEALVQAGKACKEGFVCDPYRGECWNPATTVVTTCQEDDTCGSDRICNLRGRLCTGLNECDQMASFCVKNPCVVMDCAQSCHALLGRCVQCIADCECEKAVSGEFCNEYSCDNCDASKIGFGQENPERYEFFEVCTLKDGVDPELELKILDPSVYCLPGGTGVFAKCDPTKEVLCHGDLEFVAGLRWITDEKWGRLCRIAALPWVTRVAGGHFL